MNRGSMLGQLSRQHQMMNQLLVAVPEADAYRCRHPGLAPLAWYFGRSMFMETYWLREVVQGDYDITDRARAIFISGPLATKSPWRRLPDRDHLLNWALELQDGNLLRLANPALLKGHALLENDRVLWLILQEHGENYERMLMALTQHRLAHQVTHQVKVTLAAAAPHCDAGEIPRGHYRVGAREDPASRDNEIPAQMVEMSGYRIAREPVSNGNWLAFMQAGGYEHEALWKMKGWRQPEAQGPHPDHWRRDSNGNWYGVGIQGPFDLAADEPIMGINRFEAEAYANWVAGQGGDLSGAVVQHEYQWEIAVRLRGIRAYGRAWEWCANLFQPYTGYLAPAKPEESSMDLGGTHYTLRGASLHTQPALRRASFRGCGRPSEKFLFAGTRLVFPSG